MKTKILSAIVLAASTNVMALDTFTETYVALTPIENMDTILDQIADHRCKTINTDQMEAKRLSGYRYSDEQVMRCAPFYAGCHFVITHTIRADYVCVEPI